MGCEESHDKRLSEHTKHSFALTGEHRLGEQWAGHIHAALNIHSASDRRVVSFTNLLSPTNQGSSLVMEVHELLGNLYLRVEAHNFPNKVIPQLRFFHRLVVIKR